MACMQPPAKREGDAASAGLLWGGCDWGCAKCTPRKMAERNFCEQTPASKIVHVRGLARQKLWAEMLEFVRYNPETLLVVFNEFVKALNGGEIVRLVDMKKEYHEDAWRVLEFLATVSPDAEIGKRAVAEIALMGSTESDEDVPSEILSRVAEKAIDGETAAYAVGQLKMRGAKELLEWLVEDSEAYGGIKALAANCLAEMKASDLEAEWHGC